VASGERIRAIRSGEVFIEVGAYFIRS